MKMLSLKFGIDFGINLSIYEKIILDTKEVSDNIYEEGNFEQNKIYQKTHDDGWTIKAKIESDYYSWISNFEAFHPTFGKIIGNLEEEIICESLAVYNNFVKNHPLEIFNIYDIKIFQL